MSIGWRAAAGAALAALAALAAMTVAAGGVLGLGSDIRWLQLAIGVFLLLFGVRWLAKAVAREAGLKALHDEAREFSATRTDSRAAPPGLRRGEGIIVRLALQLKCRPLEKQRQTTTA
jgi:uncharacterized membrane protein